MLSRKWTQYISFPESSFPWPAVGKTRDSGSNHSWGNNRSLPIWFHCAVCIYGAYLKWLLPESLVFRLLVKGNEDWGRDWNGPRTKSQSWRLPRLRIPIKVWYVNHCKGFFTKERHFSGRGKTTPGEYILTVTRSNVKRCQNLVLTVIRRWLYCAFQ